MTKSIKLSAKFIRPVVISKADKLSASANKAVATRKANAAAKIEAVRIEAARIASLTGGQKAMETKRANGNLSEIAYKAAATRKANAAAKAGTVATVAPVAGKHVPAVVAGSKAALLAECLRQIASL